MKQKLMCAAVVLGALLVAPVIQGASVRLTGVEFLPNKTVTIPMAALPNAPAAELSAEVKFKLGQSQIKLKYKDLKPAILYGGDVSAYVLWAVTSDGRAINLGQVQQGKKASGTEQFYVGLKGFAMLLTAEPYYMVARPSEMVLFIGGPPAKDKSRSRGFMFDALARAPKHANENINNLAWDADKTNLVLLQAKKAYEMAGRYEAETYAPEQYKMAGSELQAAQNVATDKPKSKKVENPAVNALQLSNMAINVSIRKMAAIEIMEVIEARNAQLRDAEERSETSEMIVAVLSNQQAQLRTTLDEVESENIELLSLLSGALSEVASTRIEAAKIVLTFPGVLFDSDQATLKPEAQMALAKLSGILLVFHRATMMIEGHTDSTGNESHNLELSASRANSVMKLLVDQGVADGRLAALGFGSEIPIADNQTADGRAANRRVDLVIITGQ